jgi:hypothetical protein
VISGCVSTNRARAERAARPCRPGGRSVNAPRHGCRRLAEGILGVWYVLAGVALLAPRFPRLEEWAYAGLVFNYTGAATSHLAVGDGAGALVAPIIFTGLAAASWALRPSARRDLAPS